MASSAFNLGGGFKPRIGDIVLSISTRYATSDLSGVNIMVKYSTLEFPSNMGGVSAMWISNCAYWEAKGRKELNLVALPNTDINNSSVIRLVYGDAGYKYSLYANVPFYANVNGTQKTFSAGDLILRWAYNATVNYTIRDIKLL